MRVSVALWCSMSLACGGAPHEAVTTASTTGTSRTTAEDPPDAATEPPSVAARPACVPEACLSALTEVMTSWAIFERLGVPDPDSVVWIDADGRAELLDAVGASLDDVPPPCRAPEADCAAYWEIHLSRPTRGEGPCPRAVIDLQLVLTDDGAHPEDHRIGAPRRFEDDFVGLEAEELDLETCEEDAYPTGRQ